MTTDNRQNDKQDASRVVLLVEDDRLNAKLTLHALSKAPDSSFDVELVENLAGAVKRLNHGGIDVALIDLTLPDSRGTETFYAIRAADPHVPIVVLTGLDDEDVALEMLNEGAQDYLIKDEIEPKLLARSLRFAIERQRRTELEFLNTRLAAAQKLLKRKNRRLAKLYRTAHDFVDNVSHEFRTPLTVIKEYASLVKDGMAGPITSEQEQMLAVVEDRADDLNTMVDDMLDVSKLESGLLSVNRRPCSLADIIAHVWPGLQRKAVIKGVQLEIASATTSPMVYCDPEKVGRVLINLITNAIKFCGDPGRVVLSYDHDLAEGEVRVSVIDNGKGICPEDQQSIFDRFKQLDHERRFSTKGFGLGLNIAKELVELNLGQIMLESQLGGGSTFAFTIPSASPPDVLNRYLHRLAQRKNRDELVCLAIADIDDSASELAADDANAFLTYFLRASDLLFRLDSTHWLVVLRLAEPEFTAMRERLSKALQEANRNRIGERVPQIGLKRIGTWGAVKQRARLIEEFYAALQTWTPAHA